MLLTPGTRLGPYLVDAQIGAGGMGEIYKASDTRLGRDVAVKILPISFAEDADRLRRFQQEARVIAALNHPNLLSLYDTGMHEGSPYLVTELLEGETLRQRIGGKRTTPKKTMDLAIQVAHGLAAAHDQSIVHRDLKPENIFITRDGRVKILDFGLAKVWKAPLLQGGDTEPLEGVERRAEAGMTPLFTSEAGVILGTVGYMAPEQIRAEAVDGRADIFALGAILFELLMGTPPFRAPSAIETMNAILNEESPELDPQIPGLTPVLDHLVRRCLEKRPEHRFQSVHDLAFALEHTTGSVPSVSGAWPRVERRRRFPRLMAFARAAAMGGSIGALLGILVYARFRAPSRDLLTVRALTYSGSDAMPTASPDGKTLAFASGRDGRPRIWIKQVAGGGEVALTEGPDDAPRFSRDGASLLFHRSLDGHDALYRASTLGGDVQKVVDNAQEGDWSPDGKRVVFLRMGPEGTQVGLIALQEGGERILQALPKAAAHPRWSPDGTRILLSGPGGKDGNLFLLDAATGALTRPLAWRADRPCSATVWTDAAHFLYLQPDRADVRDSAGPAALLAQEISGKAEVAGWTASFAEGLDRFGEGRLVLEDIKDRSSLKRFDLEGSAPPRWLNRGDAIDRSPALGGDLLAFSSNRSGAQNIWLLDLKSQALRRATDHVGRDESPAFSPDGKRLFWSSDRGGSFEIWTAGIEGGPPSQVSHDGAEASACTVSPDGAWVYYRSGHPDKRGIWRLHPDGGDPERLVPDGADPSISPDGTLLAFRLLKGTSREIHVLNLAERRTLPFTITLQERTGIAPSPFLGLPRWTPDGRRLAFVDQDATGSVGISAQDFAPDKDTSATRKQLRPFDPDARVEGFVFDPEGKAVIAAERQRLSSLIAMDGLGAIVPGERP
jgi:Tol biopolymer transport system component